MTAIAAVAAGLERWQQTHVVLDPVMVATSGDRLLAPAAVEVLKRDLIPRAMLITPNLHEAAALLDAPVATTEGEMRAQAERLLGIGGIYGTTSKQTKNAPIGVAGMARVIEALHKRKPGFFTCGIAGINASNAAPVIEAGADGVSVISALSMAKDPKSAASELLRVVDAALTRRSKK